MQIRKQQLELDVEQTGSKSEKEYVKAVYCHPAYLTYVQSTAWETLGWRKWEGNRQEGQGSPNGGNSLQVSDIFISLKRQEETN